MPKLSKAQQDDLAGPLTRNIRSAMDAIDKIADKAGATNADRNVALVRIHSYAMQVAEEIASRPMEEKAAIPTHRAEANRRAMALVIKHDTEREPDNEQ